MCFSRTDNLYFLLVLTVGHEMGSRERERGRDGRARSSFFKGSVFPARRLGVGIKHLICRSALCQPACDTQSQEGSWICSRDPILTGSMLNPRPRPPRWQRNSSYLLKGVGFGWNESNCPPSLHPSFSLSAFLCQYLPLYISSLSLYIFLSPSFMRK